MEHVQSPTTPSQVSSKEVSRREADQAKLRKACQDFESLFVSYLLKTMRDTSLETGLFGEGPGGEFYNSLFDAEVAQKIVRSGGLGLADILYENFVKTGRSLALSETEEAIQGPTSVESGSVTFRRIQRFHDVIEETSRKHDVPINLIYAVITQESGGDHLAVSKKGAKGLMQLMDSTVTELGVTNVFDPRENIAAGVRYLRQLLDRFDDDVKMALAAYNAGPSAVRKHEGIPPFAETREFVSRVLDLAEVYRDTLEDSAEHGG